MNFPFYVLIAKQKEEEEGILAYRRFHSISCSIFFFLSIPPLFMEPWPKPTPSPENVSLDGWGGLGSASQDSHRKNTRTIHTCVYVCVYSRAWNPRNSSRGTIERSAIGGTNRRLTFGEARTEGSWLSKRRIPLSLRRDNGELETFVVKFDPRVPKTFASTLAFVYVSSSLLCCYYIEISRFTGEKTVVREIELCVCWYIDRSLISVHHLCAVSNGDSVWM